MQPQQQQQQQQPAIPYIRAANIANYIGKPINIAGKVVTMSGQAVQLDTGDGMKVNVRRNSDDMTQVQVGTNVLVRGVVQGDTSVMHIANFPFTDLGANFDLELHNDTVDVMSQQQFSHMFTG